MLESYATIGYDFRLKENKEQSGKKRFLFASFNLPLSVKVASPTHVRIEKGQGITCRLRGKLYRCILGAELVAPRAFVRQPLVAALASTLVAEY